MQKVYLSDSGPKVSPAIYGFWRWDEGQSHSIKETEKIINLCLELGINTFDLADIYGQYQCEAHFGEIMALKSFKREDVVLFTKCGLNIPDKNRPNYRIKHYDSSRENILTSIDNSLKQLKTDYIDIFLLNNCDPLMNLEETASALMEVIANKKVKHIGIVNFTMQQHAMLASYLRTPVVTHNLELNLLNSSAVTDGRLDFIKQKHSKALAFSPLAKGKIISGNDPKSLKIRTKLQELSNKYGASVEQLAVAWVSKLGALPIIGTLNESSIINAANSFKIDLDRQDWFELYNLSQESALPDL